MTIPKHRNIRPKLEDEDENKKKCVDERYKKLEEARENVEVPGKVWMVKPDVVGWNFGSGPFPVEAVR